MPCDYESRSLCTTWQRAPPPAVRLLLWVLCYSYIVMGSQFVIVMATLLVFIFGTAGLAIALVFRYRIPRVARKGSGPTLRTAEEKE